LSEKFNYSEAVKTSALSGPACILGTKHESHPDAATTMLVNKKEIIHMYLDEKHQLPEGKSA
jgi:hypothetical protein